MKNKSNNTKTQLRKEDHIEICTKYNVNSNISSGFDDINLIHNAIPEVDFDEISTQINFLNTKIDYPLMFAAITGGHSSTKKINQNIANVAQDLNIPIGIGSQRAAIENKDLRETYKIVRNTAPEAYLVGNVGISQIIEDGLDIVEKSIEMIDANAMAIHCNTLQELIQPEGDRKFRGVYQAISDIAKNIDIPIIIKEVGSGISREVAKKLDNLNIDAIDVGGLGGTSWAAVEHYRAKTQHHTNYANLGKTFWDWGIPTAVSLVECKNSISDKMTLISTGGIKSGLDIAKSIALGADLSAIAGFILNSAKKGQKPLKNTLNQLIDELKYTMTLCGKTNITQLKKINLVILKDTAKWLKLRGFDTSIYANRS